VPGEIAPTVGKLDGSQITIGWIRNTMELSRLAFSENLLAEIRKNPDLEIVGPPRELPFDSQGNLLSLELEFLHDGADQTTIEHCGPRAL
jgi:hypothetical protein